MFTYDFSTANTTDEEALAYADGIVWSEVQLTGETVDRRWRHVGTVGDVEVYHSPITERHFYAEGETLDIINSDLVANSALADNAVCVRLHGLDAMDFWLDGEAIAEAGSIEAHFREDSLLTDEVVDIIFNRDYEIVDTNGGLIDNYCTFDCWGTCNFKAFKEALESGLDEDVIEAATAIGITLDEAAEKYIGHFDSEEDLAYHEVEQSGMLSDVPECVARYFDYEAYGRDLAIESPNHNGHYFHP